MRRWASARSASSTPRTCALVGGSGGYPSNRIVVTLYSEEQFRDVTHLPAWADGMFDGQIRLRAKGAAQNLQEFDRVLAHELTHAMVSGLANRGVPAWLHEGLASYFEGGEMQSQPRGGIRTAGVIVPLSGLQASFVNLDARLVSLAYKESLGATDILMQRVGAQTAVLLQYLGNGRSFNQAIGLFGVSAAEFEAALLRRLGVPSAPTKAVR